MIIEFTGVPGSGKSTIYSIIKEKNFRSITFISNDFNIFYDSYLLLVFLLNILKTYKYFTLFKLIFKTNNTLVHKLNIMRNIIKKVSKFLLFENKKGIYIFDEGVSHIPFNIFVDSDLSELDNNQVKNLIMKLPRADKLIVIEANQDLVLKRLQNRGHKRMNLDDKNKTEVFISKSFEVIKSIKENYTSNELICIKNDGDLKISLTGIEKKLKEIDV